MRAIFAFMQRVSWDDWRFYLAVVDTGSLSGAARLLGVNASTVSRRLEQLEDALGARLFDRQPRGYAPTSVGEAVLPAARQLMEDATALERAVVGADRSPRGLIRFTTVLELFDRVAPHLASFQARFPGIRLDVDTAPRVMSLGRFEADVALRPGKAPTELDVVGRKLCPLRVAVYASRGYLDRAGRPTDLDDLHRHRVVAGLEGDAPVGDVVVRADSVLARAMACDAGLGLAELPRFVGDARPGLVALFERPVPDLHLWLLIHTDLRRTARIRVFVDFLTEAIGVGASAALGGSVGGHSA